MINLVQTTPGIMTPCVSVGVSIPMANFEAWLITQPQIMGSYLGLHLEFWEDVTICNPGTSTPISWDSPAIVTYCDHRPTEVELHPHVPTGTTNLHGFAGDMVAHGPKTSVIWFFVARRDTLWTPWKRIPSDVPVIQPGMLENPPLKITIASPFLWHCLYFSCEKNGMNFPALLEKAEPYCRIAVLKDFWKSLRLRTSTEPLQQFWHHRWNLNNSTTAQIPRPNDFQVPNLRNWEGALLQLAKDLSFEHRLRLAGFSCVLQGLVFSQKSQKKVE